MFDHLLDSSYPEDSTKWSNKGSNSNKWSRIGFGEEKDIIEIKICFLSGALKA